jgi:hypothetical protein
MAYHHGVFRDVYGLAQSGGRKRWPPQHRGNLQIKRVGAADGKAILQGEGPVSELRVEYQEWRALHPGKAGRQDLRARRSRELKLDMALAQGLTVQQGRERDVGEISTGTEAL